MLFIPDRHEALRGEPWSEGAALAAIEGIAAAACAAFDPQTLWPVHPRDRIDESGALPIASLYMGAAGITWALPRLQQDGMADIAIDLGCRTATARRASSAALPMRARRRCARCS